jgi:hypothetical protein
MEDARTGDLEKIEGWIEGRDSGVSTWTAIYTDFQVPIR